MRPLRRLREAPMWLSPRCRVRRAKKPPFGPADNVEVVEVGSDPGDDDDEVELVKVEPAVKKEAHLSTFQEDQVLEDMEVSSLKSSGTASIRTPAQARSPPVLPAEVQVKTYVADQVHRWERDVSERGFPPNIKRLLVRAAEIQVSARAEQPRPEGVVLEPDVGRSDREVELLGRDYVRMLNVSGLQKPRSPRGLSVGEPGPKRIQRVPALSPPSSIRTPESAQSVSSSAFRSLEGARPGSMSSAPESSARSMSQATSSLFGTTGGSDESLTSAASGSRTSRESSYGSSRFSCGRDAGGHMSAVSMAMTARTLGGETAIGPAIAMYVTQETLPSNPVHVDQDDVTMSESSRSQVWGRKSKSSKRRSKGASPTPSGSSSSEGSSRRSSSERSYRSGRSRAFASSGSIQVDLNVMYQIQDAVARMETHQESALEKPNARLDLEDTRRFGPRGQGASEKLEDAPGQDNDARVHREPETQEAISLEAVRLERERAAALLAQGDTSSQNNKSKKTPKHRINSDKSESDLSSGSSDQDSDHSDSSSFEDVVPNVPTVPGPVGTMFTFQPYFNASAREDFDEKASLAVRTRWLVRFQSVAVQGGWTDKVKIYEMKLKLSAAVRNWRANLHPKRKSEIPLEFCYRLNKVADKAGIDFDSSSKQRERHLKVFTKKLLDSRLRTTLRGQHIQKLRDLEYVLKQHQEMTQGDDYDGPPPKRDFRPDNVSHGRFAIGFGGDDGDEDSQRVVEAESSTGTCSDRLLLPVRRLEKEYERCMPMSAEELSLEPAVYIHEWSELLAQLRDELAMLPELRELSPECDINKADVGERGRTTPAEEEKLRTRLRYHHRIFLGDGNVAPAPAR
ncbi:unnamed protein product [Phytophthora fragariaefolia]|uniref:Unnamed protein product n=1 Tax=Phytophthora fragariaefolia TaxID=1490495 RepID=A0A9W6Y1R9_9STRA|nr:unnamed protein product [Phytophthora fragariaefolia]